MVIDGGSGGPGRAGGNGPRRNRPGRAPRIEQPQTVIRLPKDPYENEFKAPRARRGRGVLALAAVVIVVAAVIAINSSKHGTGSSGQGASTGVGGGVPPATATVGQSAASSPAFPTQSSNGVLTGYQDTQSGAEAAATNYVATYVSEPMVHTDQRHSMIQAIADPAIASHLQSELDTAFGAAARGYGLDANGNPPAGQTLVYRGVPAGVRVDSYTNTKAVVDVWTCTVDGIAGNGSTYPVAASWATLTITLTWVNNDWRWNDFRQVDGPTPVGGTQQASSSTDLQKAAQQFARLRYAP